VLQAIAGGAALAVGRQARSEETAGPIIDAHVHVWDLNQFKLPWLNHAGPVLNRDHSVAEYLQAARRLNVVGAVYVEVNVERGQRGAEAEYAADLCARRDGPFIGAVIAADPADDDFAGFLDRFRSKSSIRGVRFLYPRGGCDDRRFLNGLRALGERQLTFDVQLGPQLLTDAAKTAAACPQTRFILDHCGGADPRPFRKTSDGDPKAKDLRDLWRRGIEALAKQSNVWCKISGVADAALPADATAEDAAPIVNFCLDAFGPDRVLFGGNWPVCLKGTTLGHWVETLRQVAAGRAQTDRRKLFHDNAVKAYRIQGFRM